MKVFVDITNPKLTYEYFKDILDFQVDGRRAIICYRNLHPYIERYVEERGLRLRKVDILYRMFVVVFGKNWDLVEECKASRVKYKYLGDFNGIFSVDERRLR